MSSADDDPDAGRLLAPATTKRKRHQVRVQGQLVLVRSVSAVHLPPPSSSPSPSTTPSDAPPLPSPGLRHHERHHDPGVGRVIDRPQSKQRSRLSTAPGRRPRSYAGADTAGALPLVDVDAHDDARDPSQEGHHDDDHDGAADTSSETEEDEAETALRDRQRRGYGIGGAGNIRRPTEVVQFYSSHRIRRRRGERGERGERGAAENAEPGRRRRWPWMSSLLLNLRGKKDDSRVETVAGIAS